MRLGSGCIGDREGEMAVLSWATGTVIFIVPSTSGLFWYDDGRVVCRFIMLIPFWLLVQETVPNCFIIIGFKNGSTSCCYGIVVVVVEW